MGYFFKKTFKRESEVDNWIHKYDMEMGEKQVDYIYYLVALFKFTHFIYMPLLLFRMNLKC